MIDNLNTECCLQSLDLSVSLILYFIFLVENEGTLKYLAGVYASNHPKMHLGATGCSNNGQSM